MKAALFAASAVAFWQLASAQPHGHRHAHDRRQEVDVTTTIVIPEVVVYVDEDGNVLGSATKSVEESTTAPTTSYTPTSVATTSSSSSSATPTTTSSESAVEAYQESSSSAPATSSSSASSSSSAATASSTSSGSIFSGLKGATYNAYNTDGSCMSASDVASQIAELASDGYNAIRLYAVDCDTISSAVPAAKKNGLAVLAGLYNLDSITSDLESMSTQLDGDFSYLSALAVGNEWINSGEATVSQVVDAIKEARDYLETTNFAGKVTSVDTFNVYLDSSNSALVDAVDFIGSNCHAIFDTQVAPSGAGDYVQSSCLGALSEISSGKEVVITESGWACENPADDAILNIASTAAQVVAAALLRDMNLFFFSPYSTIWQGTDTINGYFGLGTCS